MIKITITPSGSSAFTIEDDLNMLAAYISSQTSKPANTAFPDEFAGLVSDEILFNAAESLEIDI